MPYSYGLAQHGNTLATRPFAKQLRADLLERAHEQDIVELDFTGVRSISHSFADEFVARLVEDAPTPPVTFEVTMHGANGEVERVISGALERRGLTLPEYV